jgi:predicted PurR-regulated permease PerM
MLKELYLKNQLFFLVLGILAVGFLIWYFAPIVICVLIAGVIMIIGRPVVERLDKLKIGKFKMPRAMSAGITLAAMVAGLLGLLAFIIPLIVKEINMLVAISPEQFMSYFSEEIDRLQATLIQYGVMAQDETIVTYLKDSLMKVMNADLITQVLNNIFTIAGKVFFYFFTTLFLAFFFLLERGMLRDSILALFPEKHEQKVSHILYSSKKLLSRYFIGLLAQVLSLSLLVSVGLLIIGVGGAFPIGFFAGVMNIIPYVGFAIAIVLGILLAVTGVISTGAYAAILPIALKTLAVFVISNMIDNTFFQPFYFGKSVKASPVEIFLVIIAAGFIGGVIGMIVAVPAYTFIRIVAREFFSEFRVVRKLTDHI